MWRDRRWIDLFIPWNLLPVRLLHLMLLFLCPLCFSLACTIIWPWPWEASLLNETFVLETLHFWSEASWWLDYRDPELIQAILLNTLRWLHGPIDLLETSHICLVSPGAWIQKGLWFHCFSHRILSSSHDAERCISKVYQTSYLKLTEEAWEYMVYELRSGLDRAMCCFLYH